MIDLNQIFERVKKAEEYRDQLESYALYLDGEEQELGAAMLRAAGKEMVEIATLWYGAEAECRRHNAVTLKACCVASDGRRLVAEISFPMYPYIEVGKWIEMPIPPDWTDWDAQIWAVDIKASGIDVFVGDDPDCSNCVFKSVNYDDLKDGLTRCGYKIQEVKRVKSENV
jgi:hypothetical protein